MESFDWVTAIAECSVICVFKELEEGIKADVEARSAIRAPGEPLFVFVSEVDTERVAVLHGDQSVVFSHTDRTIAVENGDGCIAMEAAPILDFVGRCRLKVGDQELTLHEFRRAALEALFFEA